MLTDAQGGEAVRLARRAVAATVGLTDRDGPPAESALGLGERHGAFVTLRRFPSGALRGCIGYPLPAYPLGVTIRRAAAAAARDDPRFPPVRADELPTITVEVSVLTVPTPVDPDRRPSSIEAGRDGLIVETDSTSGLLLPQVATEMGWTAEELLEGVCEKAGLPAGTWRDPRVRLRRFEAEIFGERSPNGPVERTPGEVRPNGARRERRS